MKRTVLIGYDPEHGGADALRLGRLLAEVLAARPMVATAVAYPDWLMGRSDLQHQVDAETRAAFESVRDQLRDLRPETRAIASRSAALALHELAETEAAMTIVLGSSHRGILGRTLNGSVGESLMHGAPCPIAIAPRGYAERPPTSLLRLAVAFDGSPEAWTALETAIGIAERCHGEVTVISVAEDARYGYATAAPLLTAGEFHDYEREDKQRLLELASSRMPEGLPHTQRLLGGEAGELLSQASEDLDLIIAGSRGYGPLRRTLLGSTTRTLITQSVCPVLVMPRGVGVDPLAVRVGSDRRADPKSPRVSS